MNSGIQSVEKKLVKCSVARCGLFPAKWLIFKSGGGQKLVALSHQNVADFEVEFGGFGLFS